MDGGKEKDKTESIGRRVVCFDGLVDFWEFGRMGLLFWISRLMDG